jgi:hypothetical protein
VALIIGVNKPFDPTLTPLQYADDDAARYLDLFSRLDIPATLLARLDENTQRLHPQAVKVSQSPTRPELQTAVQKIAAQVAQAHARKKRVVFYFVYAGHGGIDANGQGYLLLEDSKLTGDELALQVLETIGADQAHVIVDACYSYYLAYGRGPGGERRPVKGFSGEPALAKNEHWGLLLSTSSAKESHEWEAIQAGVFSHEVRSGLYGAADANGDGIVSYSEMAAFVSKANADIANEKYRPDLFARPPQGDDTLLDLRKASGRKLRVEGTLGAHYFLEDERGVRLADFHNSNEQKLELLLPDGPDPLYLERADSSDEFVLPKQAEPIRLSQLVKQKVAVHTRNAAAHAFDHLFALPFDEKAVDQYRAACPVEPPPKPESKPKSYPDPKPIQQMLKSDFDLLCRARRVDYGDSSWTPHQFESRARLCSEAVDSALDSGIPAELMISDGQSPIATLGKAKTEVCEALKPLDDKFRSMYELRSAILWLNRVPPEGEPRDDNDANFMVTLADNCDKAVATLTGQMPPDWTIKNSRRHLQLNQVKARLCEPLRQAAQKRLDADQQKQTARLAPFRKALSGDKLRIFERLQMWNESLVTSGGQPISSPEELARASSWYQTLSGPDSQGNPSWTSRGWYFEGMELKRGPIERNGSGDWPSDPDKAYP